MQVRHSSSRLLGFFVVLGFSMQSQSLKADRPVRPELQSGNEEIEYHLEHAGVSTDPDSLIRAARTSKDLLVRGFAVQLLGDRGERRAIDDLEAVYRLDEVPLIREAAALALAQMSVPGAIAKVEGCLRQNTRDLGRQMYLATRLAEFGDFVGYPYIVAAATSTNPHLRELAAMNLVRFATSGMAETESETAPRVLLAKLLNDSVAEVRRAVILNVSIGKSGGFDAADFVGKIAKLATEDPDPDVRYQAETFLLFHKPTGSEEATP